MDFDLKLYPQMTIRNMDEIANYKQFIKSNNTNILKRKYTK